MNHFYSVDDVEDIDSMIQEARALKDDPWAFSSLGHQKVLGLVFFNSSLRTRMSTTKAAYQLGLRTMILNVTSDSWQLEMEEGVVMNADKAEHIKEAAQVMGTYCDILGVRSFPALLEREKDYQDLVIRKFMRYAGVPIVSLESSVLHPLQSLADLITIEELKSAPNPKVVMTWAPHVKSLPQAVPNSFAQWMKRTDMDFHICCPEYVQLNEEYTMGAKISFDQEDTLEGADFVYVKNWSSFNDYGKLYEDSSWKITREKLKETNNAKVMHCLPVRRNVVIADEILDSEQSVVMKQAENRIFAAQVVLKKMLEKN